MTKLTWDQTGERLYETGVDHGVLYIPDNSGIYSLGVAWNGLTTVTETPSGADSTKTYADNIPYLNLISIEEFGATIEAYTCPDEFLQFDGMATPTPGLHVGQQSRHAFGLCYRTRLGNDLVGTDFGYKIHLVYNATAAPSQKAYASINDKPEAIALSWVLMTIPVPIDGILKPTALITVNSTEVDPTDLAALELILYGTSGVDPRLPTPAEVIALFAGSVTVVTPTVPSFTSPNITIPTVTGVVYRRDDTDAVVTGTVAIAGASGSTLVIKAYPTAGHTFASGVDDDWMYTKA